MPRPPVIQWRKKVSATASQLKKKGAASIPVCNSTSQPTTGQFTSLRQLRLGAGLRAGDFLGLGVGRRFAGRFDFSLTRCVGRSRTASPERSVLVYCVTLIIAFSVPALVDSCCCSLTKQQCDLIPQES